ncbi:uncharacterized protein BDR25DRAFT_353445 [Lindgomyces ingoldianus]|uniref:Uncharacterized protein n=1 Tax=Lindgomyces ingoldianus TaxID=673940 RepID=A0ACB6R260_9PLEO|nr:uncharacterized protein BDR25DRAFT_353445 [Lindgomyces ingoldianus]KAF2472415.1 hypothetical protein BDR25DRAFT_353445 [Lindgomyces ingoldianus]
MLNKLSTIEKSTPPSKLGVGSRSCSQSNFRTSSKNAALLKERSIYLSNTIEESACIFQSSQLGDAASYLPEDDLDEAKDNARKDCKDIRDAIKKEQDDLDKRRHASRRIQQRHLGVQTGYPLDTYDFEPRTFPPEETDPSGIAPKDIKLPWYDPVRMLPLSDYYAGERDRKANEVCERMQNAQYAQSNLDRYGATYTHIRTNLHSPKQERMKQLIEAEVVLKFSITQENAGGILALLAVPIEFMLDCSFIIYANDGIQTFKEIRILSIPGPSVSQVANRKVGEWMCYIHLQGAPPLVACWKCQNQKEVWSFADITTYREPWSAPSRILKTSSK